MLGLELPALVFRLVALLVAATVHEFAHAWMADRLGDPTPRLRGRLSLNPLVHLDLVGSLLLLLVGFGWAKPVEVNPRNFTRWRQGMMLVAAAGPLANVTLLFLLGLVVQGGVVADGLLGRLVFTIMVINAVLAVFNLLPIPPLDGSRILAGLLPPRQALAYDRLQPYGPLVLLVVLVLPGNLVGRVLWPPTQWLVRAALGGGFF
ncbi:MAG: site-2 protease family protein [Armatimonadota bacterium]|nr:site-2 protease family protein [Armatimonadota bacterium]